MLNSNENINLAINIFCKTLKEDQNPIIRQKAAETLGKLGSNQALETLLSVWENDDNINVRCTAADAILEIIKPQSTQDKSMSDAPIFNFNNSTIGNVANTVEGDQKNIQHNYASPQKLSEAATEIKQLLEQLNLNYSPETEAEKETLANQINNTIKTDSRLRQILLEGGIELVKILCPWLGIPITMGQKWLETAKNNN